MQFLLKYNKLESYTYQWKLQPTLKANKALTRVAWFGGWTSKAFLWGLSKVKTKSMLRVREAQEPKSRAKRRKRSRERGKWRAGWRWSQRNRLKISLLLVTCVLPVPSAQGMNKSELCKGAHPWNTRPVEAQWYVSSHITEFTINQNLPFWFLSRSQCYVCYMVSSL